MNARGPLVPAAGVIDEIRSRIECERDRICREIGGYPTPIPACDVHFNRLLEERRRVFEELDRLKDLCPAGSAGGSIAALDEFIASSAAIDDADKNALRSALMCPGGGA